MIPDKLINFHSFSNEKQLKTVENSILKESDLIRIEIPQRSYSSSNIFLALSYGLYMTTNFDVTLQKLCIETLHDLLLQSYESIPRRLRIFFNNNQFFADYCSDIRHPKFLMYSLEIISLLFQTKIIIYEIDDSEYLRATILNNEMKPHLQLFKNRFGHFDFIETYSFMKNFQLIKTLTLDIVEIALWKSSVKKSTRRDSDRIFEELNRDIENEINNPELPELPIEEDLKEKGKSYLESNTTLEWIENNTTTIDQTAEKQKAEQFFFNCSQSELMQRFLKPNQNLDHNELFTPQPKQFPKIKDNPTQFRHSSSLLSDHQKNEYNMSQNPFGITLDKNERSLQNESPKFNNISNNSNKLSDENENSSQKSKKQKNISLKCTSEEFVIPSKGNEIKTAFTPTPMKPMAKKQPLVLEESRERFFGTVKFFDDVKGYGFLIMDIDNTEIFVHFDDFDKNQGIQKEFIMTYKLGNIIRVSFNCMKYIGKYNMSRKAVDVQVISTSF